MIPFDFDYYKPNTIKEAVDTFMQLDAGGKRAVYYGGGSELISMARVGNLIFDAVIDLKAIPECRADDFDRDNLILGSSLTLSDIKESNRFPLLGKTAGRVADHTMQCKITLGGNLASTIIYRETVLPLLLTDSKLVVASQNGGAEHPIDQVFGERLRLQKGEFIVSAIINKRYLHLPYLHMKKTKNEKIDYPLFTTAALKADGSIRIAFSGLASYPFRNSDVEGVLNDGRASPMARAAKVSNMLSGVILDDLSGTAQYRKFVLKNTVINVLETMRDA